MHIAFLIKQKPNERVLYVLHRHSITFIPYVLLFLILGILPIAIYFLFVNVMPDIFNSETIFPVLILLGSIYYLSILLFFYSNFVDFFLDVWIITDDRIVDIEQYGILAKSITEVELHRIQDVTTHVHGIFPTLFHYGNVVIKTASDTKDIIFRNVPFPNKIRGELIKLSRQDRHKQHAGAYKEVEN